MAPAFIFADQIRKIIKSGKKEIEVPAGVRISPAAADLIKEHGIKIKTLAAAAVSDGEKSGSGDKPIAPARSQSEADQTETPVRPADNPPATKTVELAGEELDAIVTRVLERLEQLHGRHARESEADKAAESAPADGDDLVICRCEEITRREIKDAVRNGIQTLNGVKRITRAGMGLCQGQTCQRLVTRILQEELGLSAAEIDPTTARGPVRPLSLGVFANS